MLYYALFSRDRGTDCDRYKKNGMENKSHILSLINDQHLFFTHVLHGRISGDLLELTADHFRPRAASFLVLSAPDTDYARYNKSH